MVLRLSFTPSSITQDAGMDADFTLAEGGARRGFLKRAGVAVLGVASLGAGLSRVAFAADPDKPPPKPENVISPGRCARKIDTGQRPLREGRNETARFQGATRSAGRRPESVRGDSELCRFEDRAEYAFDAARGDLFVVRVAGQLRQRRRDREPRIRVWQC
jgi:carbonic anhydrase